MRSIAPNYSIRVHLQRISSRNYLTFELLLIDLGIKDAAGNTPLHLAVENDALDALDFLLSS